VTPGLRTILSVTSLAVAAVTLALVFAAGLAPPIAVVLVVPIALGLAWLVAAAVDRRVRAIAAVAARYRRGDLAEPAPDYGSDEIGAVARAFDASVRELGRRLDELSRDRARMEAILSGMVEGVLVVDRQGRLQLVNHAAQQMLHVDPAAHGRSYPR
jgi:two-component system phosphate regulon sensor histidine kinase PhoR